MRSSGFKPKGGHVTSFAKMMTARTESQDLPGWLKLVEADDQSELHSFAAGIRQDINAVTAGLTLCRSPAERAATVRTQQIQDAGHGPLAGHATWP